MACPACSRALCALRAHVPYALYVPYVPMRRMCLMCPLVQVYFTDLKTKNWKLCTHNFLAKMRILIDILLKDDVYEKMNFDKIKFYS